MGTPEIIPRGEIPLRPPTAPLTPMPAPDGWIAHYVGSNGLPHNPTIAQSKQLIVNLQRDALNNLRGEGYIDIEYNFLIDPCGRIFEGRGWLYKSGANGSLTSNAHAWAVCYLGGPDTPVTAEAKRAFLDLTQAGARRAAAVSYVRGHDSIIRTGCPGDHVRAILPELNLRLHDAATVTTKVVPMHSPALTILDAADCKCPTGGAWIVGPDGAVYAVGGAPYKGGANGKPYWGTRRAARIEPNSRGGYTITATDGKQYSYPE